MSWMVPEMPEGPTEPATVVELNNALLSPWSIAAPEQGVVQRSKGAVYSSDGVLQPASLRAGGFAGDRVRPVDPEQYEGPKGQRLAGRWLYGGHWMDMYGHFLTETMTSLWVDPAEYDQIVFHRFLHRPSVNPWQMELLARAGWAKAVYVTEIPLQVDQLVLPSRPFFPGRSTTPESVVAWQRAVRPAPAQPPLFMSRSRMPQNKQRTEGDERLDDEFAELGFRIMHPQDTPITEQLRAAGGAPVIAGLSGSALHVCALLPEGPRVLELGDPRTAKEPVRTQVVIDAARERMRAFVHWFPEAPGSRRRDVSRTMAAVRELL